MHCLLLIYIYSLRTPSLVTSWRCTHYLRSVQTNVRRKVSMSMYVTACYHDHALITYVVACAHVPRLRVLVSGYTDVWRQSRVQCGRPQSLLTYFWRRVNVQFKFLHRYYMILIAKICLQRCFTAAMLDSDRNLMFIAHSRQRVVATPNVVVSVFSC